MMRAVLKILTKVLNFYSPSSGSLFFHSFSSCLFKVVRTKDRPLANETISYPKAWTFLALQLSAGLAILLQLNLYR